MKKRILKIVGILFGIILFYFLLKFYTNQIRNFAIEECQAKFNTNINKDYGKKESKDSEINLKSLLIDRFDKQSYDSILGIDSPKKAFLYSLIVANKWNDGNASFDVFRAIATLDSSNNFNEVPDLDFLDQETINIAIAYLKKASHNGPINAKYTLGKYYLEGKYIKKDKELGKKLLKEADELSNGILK